MPRPWPVDSPLRRLAACGHVPDADDTARLVRSARGRANALRGASAQGAVVLLMKTAGYKCVEPIETGWKITRRNGKVVDAKPRGKVAGDVSAVSPVGGLSVLVEIKQRPESLSLSDFEPHQLERLQSRDDAGGIGLVAWHHREGISLIRWDAFRHACTHGHPLKVVDALRMDPLTGRAAR